MSWGIQVLLNDGWTWLRPSQGTAYEFTYEEDAHHMMGVCFPDKVIEARLGGNKVVRVHPIEESK
jgi:hypothetical protein